VVNPVVVLSAIAARTGRIRLGILMTALPRRRVQLVAKETATLDRLSGGRLVFGAGLGSMDAEYADFGEDPDLRSRAVRLDESLSTLTRLWRELPPAPVQRPRIPIWCPGRWPTRAGFRRAARWDGAVPTFRRYGRQIPVPVDEFARVVDFLARERGSLDSFDIGLEGRAADGLLDGYRAAGLTWWIEAMGWWRGGVAEARTAIEHGPPA
jgi:alkanesulfonate monooxygenase SsuD/methylene tetrahydromethanopterin reductase-like flavin-dependent oxidoreductase (luciferase family)